MDIKDIAKRLHAVTDKSAFAIASKVSRATIYRIMNGWPNPEYKTLQLIEKQLVKTERKAKKSSGAGACAK